MYCASARSGRQSTKGNGQSQSEQNQSDLFPHSRASVMLVGFMRNLLNEMGALDVVGTLADSSRELPPKAWCISHARSGVWEAGFKQVEQYHRGSGVPTARARHGTY